MAYMSVSCCATNTKQKIESQHRVELLGCEEKMALITDVVLVAIVAVVATLTILANSGFNLGDLSGIGGIGNQAAYFMYAIGGLILFIDVVMLIVQMRHHIHRLAEVNTTLENTVNKHPAVVEANKLTKETEKQKASIQKLEANLLILQQEAEKSAIAIQTLESQLQDQEAKIDGAENQLAAVNKLNAASQQRYDSIVAEREALKLLVDEKTLDASDIAKKRIEHLEDTNAKLTKKEGILQELDELNARLQRKKQSLDSLTQKIQEQQEQNKMAVDEHDQKALQLQSLITDIKSHANALAKIKEDHGQATLRLNELEGNRKDAEIANQTLLEKAAADAKELVDKATFEAEQIQKAASQKAKETIEEANQVAKATQDNASKFMAEAKEVIDLATQRAHEMTNEAQSKTEEAKKQADQLIAEANAEKEDLLNTADQQTKTTKAEAEKILADVEKAKMEANLQIEESQNRRLQEAQERANEIILAAQQTAQKQNEDLEVQLKTTREELAALQVEEGKVRTNLTAQQEELKKAGREISKCQEECERAKENTALAESQLKKLQKELEEVGGQIAQAKLEQAKQQADEPPTFTVASLGAENPDTA